MRRLAAATGALVVLAALLPGVASAARVAVGLHAQADPAAVARAIEKRTGSRPDSLAPIRALVADLPAGVSLRGIRGVRYVEVLPARRLALAPTDPLVSRQWYLRHSRFYESWPTLPAFEAVPVAIIDSGVDGLHPELNGRILAAKSFVKGSPRVDRLGHGTFVAGLIAAGVDNGIGIAGLAPSAELIVAKVVTPSRTIPIEAEVRAIRWAVEQGAQVINMSLGGVRDPLDPNRDSFSRLEADAVAYAVESGAVVVAAVGNSDSAPASPWRFASYPAALPHVIGVSAIAANGTVPTFSNRDRIYNDIAAPGDEILSIFPRPLTGRFPACSEQGYSSCGPDEYREAQGTSFAAPQVTAAAAVLLSLRPSLKPEQVSSILTRTAVDQSVLTGADGTWALAPGNGCYLLHPADPPGWRMSGTRADAFPEGTPGYSAPVGRARPGKLDQGIGNLQAGTFRYASMGDSIAANFNLCSSQGSFWYSQQVRDRLLCASPTTSFVLGNPRTTRINGSPS